MSWEAVIGLEIHAQLATRSKLFCNCATSFGASPNSQTCAVCLGLPGVLPVLNRQAVILAVRAAIALGCTLQSRSEFARKNYFYPDLPKGYQISQFEQQFALGGAIPVSDGATIKPVELIRVHLEEDAGKMIHGEGPDARRSSVDFNRGGVPLIEIVTAPVLRSATEAATTMRALRQLLRYLEVCDGNLEEGSLRCDANVSLRPTGSTDLGTRTELKNLNSFRFVEQAVGFEIERQAQILDRGGVVSQQTRHYDAVNRQTRALRSKEEAHDYRYFPEPDLPPLELRPVLVDEIAATLPELPAVKRRRYEAELGLSPYDAELLTEEPQTAQWFEAALAAHGNAKAIANWVINEVGRESHGRPLAELRFSPAQLAALVALIDSGKISGAIAKQLFAQMVAEGGDPVALVAARGLEQLNDSDAVAHLVDQVLAANPDSVRAITGGKDKALGFLVGQVMRLSGGKANPQLVNRLLRDRLSRG